MTKKRGIRATTTYLCALKTQITCLAAFFRIFLSSQFFFYFSFKLNFTLIYLIVRLIIEQKQQNSQLSMSSERLG